MENNLKYISYSRKSSESKEKQALSIIDQNAESEKCTLKDGLNVILKLEEAKSAFKPNHRPEFKSMLDKIKGGEANAILTWKPDRLCRNPEEGGILLQMLQDGVLKEIRTATGDVYTQDSDHLVLQIHFGMANQYSRNLSQNVKRGINHKCERGQYPREAPVGFEGFGERGNRNIKPHPFEAPIILEAFQLASDGQHSLGNLVEFIYSKSLRTRRGKKISKSHLYSILTSPIYYGYFYHAGELYQGSYKPIVGKSLFEVVQAALKDRSKPRVHSWNSAYNGLVRCPSCGCAITTTVKVKRYKRTRRTATYAYLHCTRRKGGCDQSPIPLDIFEQQLIDNISQIGIDEEVWALGIKLLKEKHGHEVEKNNNQRVHLQTKYNSYQDKLNRLIDMRADEEITREEFITQKELLLKEQARIKELLEDSEGSSHNWLELAENFLNTAFHARDVIKSEDSEKKRDLIMAVGKNYFLRDKKLEFSFKKPYDVLLKPVYRTNWLPG